MSNKIDVPFYISKHENYIKALERAIREVSDFNHKECCRDKKENCCAFGEMFYRDLWPKLEDFPPHIQERLREVEELHCLFHEEAKKIDTKNPEDEAFRKVKDTSLKLYKALISLQKELEGLDG